MKCNIIGITGLARCGKDSFFNMASDILKNEGIKTKRFAFADCLKSECNEILEKYPSYRKTWDIGIHSGYPFSTSSSSCH